MKLVFRLIVIAALIALGYWAWTVFFPGDEAVIRKRLNRLATLMSFESPEGNFARLANVEEAAGLFAPEVDINIDAPPYSQQMLTGKTELRQTALAVRTKLASLQVKFLDQNVRFSADGTSATVNLTAEVRVPSDRELVVQELTIQLRKIEGKWLIMRVETVHTLT